jgi:hypothetical protein
MMEHMDKLVIGLSDNEPLSDHFSRKEVGERCTLTIDKKYELEAQIDEVQPGKMVVLSLVVEPEPEKEAPVKVSKKEPVDTVMMAEV